MNAAQMEAINRYGADTTFLGELADHQGIGEATEPGCGDTLRYTVKTGREIIAEIGYSINESACMTVKACAAVAAHLAKDKPVMEAYLITADTIAKKLGGLDQEGIHCAMMAELALKRTLANYARRRGEDWI